MILSKREILLILDLLHEKYGGYAEGEVVRLQAKLSIMLEVAASLEKE